MADKVLIYYYLVAVSGGILVYSYLLYPILIFILERIFFKPVSKKKFIPDISFVISAYNEEAVIAEKIENLLSLDYPADKREIIVASDGSTDKTVEIAERYLSKGIVVHNHTMRKGKANVLNAEVPECRNDIIILVDARQRITDNAIRELVYNFSDPEVGGVSGQLMLEDNYGTGISKGMGFYWKYEKFIRTCESGIHSTVGATGALLAFRKELWLGLPPETVVDDMVLPFQIIRQGKRVILDNNAEVYDNASESWDREFVRKTRTLGGNFQILFNMREMGLPFFSPVSFQFFSHKVLRLLGPLAICALFWGNYWLFRLCHFEELLDQSLVWGGLLVLQGLFYLSAIAGFCAERLMLKVPLVHIPYSFVLSQIAIVCGFLRFGSGREDAIWEKTLNFEKNSLNKRLIRLFADSTIFCFGIIMSFYLRYSGKPPEHIFQLFSNLNPSFLVAGFNFAVPLVMIIPLSVFYFFRLNERRSVDTNPEFYLNVIYAVFSSTIVVVLLVYNMRSTLTIAYEGKVAGFPSAVLVLSFFVNCFIISGWRLLVKAIHKRSLISEGAWREIIIVGEGGVDKIIQKSIEVGSNEPTRIIGTVGPVAHKAFVDLARKEDIGSIPSILQADELIAATGILNREQTMDVLNSADKHRVNALLLPDDLELMLGASRLRLISYIPVLPAWKEELIEPIRIVKKVFDILWGLFLFLFNMPGLLVYVAANGFSFSSSLKTGMNGNVIKVIRPASCSNNVFKRSARRFFLGLSLLQGDLSVIGPKPVSLRRYNDASALEKSFIKVRPGLAGPSRITIPGKKRIARAFLPYAFYVYSYSLSMDLFYLTEMLFNISIIRKIFFRAP
ncbi:MAG: glycosyltransferase family 2 protein [Planctomycetota bacterium]|jgi:glycosyltransferase involved in cell wall biosynthesis/lipopolysaccharide/colanic/teichoic acid biosynthesis glycosyltransferase